MATNVSTEYSCPVFHHQHAVYHLGSMVLCIGLIVPANSGRPQILWLRVVLSIVCLCYALWGGAVLCWTDAFIWFLACFFINFIYVVQQAFIIFPVKLDENLLNIYMTLFANFKVSKRTFKSLIGSSAGGMKYELKAYGKYATEGRTNCSKQLSLLIQGRMKVSRGGIFLHYIRQGQFIDSPEWEAVKDGTPRSFQVTIQADTDCHYIQWSRPELEAYLKRNSVMRAIMDAIIGKDITEKLYSIGEKEIEPVLYVGVEGEVTAPEETVQLLVPEDDQLFSHRWERATSIETDPVPNRPSIRSHSGTTYLTVPGAEDMGSALSLHRRSIVDVRASIASGKSLTAGSRLSSDDVSHSEFLTPPQSIRGSFTSSPASPSILVE